MRIFPFLALLLITSLFLFKAERQDYSIDLPSVKSSLGTKENPEARSLFQERMLASPLTGKVPLGIRERELLYDQKLSSSKTYIETSNARATQTNWDLAGPFNIGGRTRGAAIDVRNSDIIIAGGVSGGIWKTEDSGGSWERMTSPEIHNGISFLIQDTRAGRENTWYASTGEQVGNSARGFNAPYRGNGIMKSTDNGDTWNFLASTQSESPELFNNQFQYTWNMLVNTFNTSENEIFLASYGGILRSKDGGDTWSVALGNKLFDLPEDENINESVDPSYTHIIQNAEGHFFASLSTDASTDANFTDGGYYFSENGEDWTVITPGGLSSYHERTVIASGASSPDKVYFLTHISGNSDELWLYTYGNVENGVPNGSWQNLSDNIPYFGGDTGDFNAQSGYNMVVAVHPKNENIVFLGGTNLYRSTDGFLSDANSKIIGGYMPDLSANQYPSHHADQHLLLFYPEDANKALSSHDGGLSISTGIANDSVIYRSINNGYLTSQFFTIAQQKDEASDIITGGMQDNGTFIRESLGINPSWSKLIFGDGAYTAIAPNKDFVYVGLQEGLIFRLSLSRTNEIIGFARVDPSGGGEGTGQEYLFINPFMLDPLNGNKMYLAGGDAIWKNRNLVQIPNGLQDKTSIGWEELRDTRLRDGIYTALDKSADILYAGAFIPFLDEKPQIVKISNISLDDEEEIEELSPSELPEFGYISCIKVDPENPDFVLLILSNYEIPSVFLSEDGAKTFIDVSGDLEEFPDGTGGGPSVRWAEIVQTQNGNKYYVGTSIGLFSTDELLGENTVWVREGEDVIGRSIVTMMDYRGIDGRMVVATHGNGTFRTFIDDYRNPANEIEANFTLSQNYPNPFDDDTLIEFTLPEDDVVRVDIFDSQGQIVRNLLWGPQYAGTNSVSWDGLNSYGSNVRNGVYYYQLTYKGKTKSKRIVYVN